MNSIRHGVKTKRTEASLGAEREHFDKRQIRETVLSFISQNGQHQKLLKTKHFKHLKELIVSSGQLNQVKDLVDYLISQNCQDDADSLAREYMKHREHQRGKTLTNGSASPSCLKEILNMQNGVSG